jgi:hypothetical protein
MDKKYFSLEEQEVRIQQNKEADKLIKSFRKALKVGYEFNPKWLLDKQNINFSVLRDLDENEKDFPLGKYQILITPLDNLLEHMIEVYRYSYVKKKLWTLHEDKKIARALKFWEDGNAMIPPILIPHSELDQIIPHDGKHRIAVCHFFDVKEIPVIISDSDFSKMPASFISKAKIIQGESPKLINQVL